MKYLHSYDNIKKKQRKKEGKEDKWKAKDETICIDIKALLTADIKIRLLKQTNKKIVTSA